MYSFSARARAHKAAHALLSPDGEDPPPELLLAALGGAVRRSTQ